MRVLLIEDNPGDVRLVQEILKEARGNFTVSVAEKLGPGMKLLLSQDIDVVLLDLNLPDSHGLATLTELQTRFSRMPIVVMTSHDDEELAHKAVQLGAQDYLAKGNVNGELLRRTLEYAVERKKSEVALRNAHDEMELRVEERTQELKKAERGLKELNETLEERVAERTAELQGVNIFLRNSHRATLNMMEDALASRKVAEEANVELLREVVERKRAETTLLRLNKALKALSDSSQAVIRAKDEPEYLNDVCGIIVEDCGYSMTWIGFAENDDAKSVRPAAYAGFEEGYLETLKLTWADTERGRGPTGTAIRTGKVAVCRNMLTDPAFTPWREDAIKRGFASSIVFPMRSDGRVFGAISMYSKEDDPFTEDEIRLLTELTDNVAYGIEVLRIRAAQKQAEEALRESENRVRRKLDSILSPEGDLGDLDLSDIIDASSVQVLMNDFYKLAHMPMSIVDLKGKMLVGVGWQKICIEFHRVHPEACRNCTESDLQLSAGVPQGEFKLYKCKNNMWDVATPIVVGGKHMGNLFMGQFFFEDEPLDYEFFRAQAGQYGFDEKEYLAALEAVPRLSRDALDESMAFFMKLADVLSKSSYSNLKLARSLAQRDALTDSLRESEGRLKRAQEMSHLGSWELDLVDNRLTWSDEVYRIFGLQPREFSATYEAFLEAIHPDDRDAVNAAYFGSIRDGKDTYEIEHRVVRKATEEIRYVHEKCEHFRDESGKIIRSVGMVHDITERKNSEREREITIEFLHLVNSSTGTDALIKAATTFFQEQSGCEAVGVRLKKGDDYPYYEARGFPKEFVLDENSLCAKDASGDILRDTIGNPVLACMCGNIICGRFDPIKDFFSKGGSFWTNSTTRLLASTTDADRKARTRNRCNGEGYESVALVPLKAGEERLGLVQLNDRRKGIFAPEAIALWERLAGYLSIAIVKFRAEQDVLDLSDGMAARNQELESVNKELESFIYSVSHDLRAPIRTMSGFAKIINEDYAGKLDAKGRDYLNRILRGSEKSTQLIDDLLHLSRISRQGLDRIGIDLSRKASKVAAELREMNQGRNVEVAIQKGMTVSVDPRLIELALSNLLGNAWKFTSKTEKARIEFGAVDSPLRISECGLRNETTTEQVRQGKTVYFIRDNGAGFDMKYADKMFWPFHRLHTDKEFEGTGIGLTIVERIIHRHGGKMWAEGEVGRGATVFFTLG